MRILSAGGILLLGLMTLALGGSPGTPKKEDVPKYLGMLKNGPNAKDRALGAEMLGKRGAISAADVAQAMDPLKTALQKDKDFSVRKAAAEALGNIGAEPEKVVPLLMGALKEKNTPLKLGAITALAQYGGDAKDALPVLREIAQEKTEKMLSNAASVAIKAIAGKKK